MEILAPVDALGSVPLLALALFIKAQQVVATLDLGPVERGLDLARDPPVQAADVAHIKGPPLLVVLAHGNELSLGGAGMAGGGTGRSG
jgi:hypothetical protein